MGGADDDVGDGGGDADLDARVTFLGQLALEELVELGVEDTVGDEFSPLGATELSAQSFNAVPQIPSSCSLSRGATIGYRRFRLKLRGEGGQNSHLLSGVSHLD